MEEAEIKDLELREGQKSASNLLLTFNLLGDDPVATQAAIIEVFKQIADYAAWIREKGTHEHLHAYIELKKATKIPTIKLYFDQWHPHIDIPRRRNAAQNYCTVNKDLHGQTILDDGSFGDWWPDKGKKRSIMEDCQALIEQALTHESDIETVKHEHWKTIAQLPGSYKAFQTMYYYALPIPKVRQIRVSVYWGNTSTGKTQRACSGDSYYILSAPNAERGAIWFDNYNGQLRLVIDDYNGRWLSLFQILQFTDGQVRQVPIKGGFVYCYWNEVVITSNRSWKEWWRVGEDGSLGELDAFHERCIGRGADKRTDAFIHFKRDITPLKSYIYSTVNEEE